MKKFSVMFSQYTIYEVEAENEDDAQKKAYREFYNDMCAPVAHVIYDECEIKCLDEEDEDEEEDWDWDE